MGAGHSHTETPVAFQLQLSFHDDKENVITLSKPYYIVSGNKERNLITLIDFLAAMKRLGGDEKVSRIRAHIFAPVEISESLAEKIDELKNSMSPDNSFFDNIQRLKLFELGQQKKDLYLRIEMFSYKHKETLLSMIERLLSYANYPNKYTSVSSITASE